jgi:hypothetical protein
MTPDGLAARVTVRPPDGAGAETLSVRVFFSGPARVVFWGERLRLPDARTVWRARPKPGAVAVMSAEPRLTPVTWGCTAGVVEPTGMVTVPGEMETLVASLLVRVTTTPPAGAGADKVTGKAAL